MTVVGDGEKFISVEVPEVEDYIGSSLVMDLLLKQFKELKGLA